MPTYSPEYTQVWKDEITVTPDDFGGLHTSLPVSEVRHPEVGGVVYFNGTRWEVEDVDGGVAYLVSRDMDAPALPLASNYSAVEQAAALKYLGDCRHMSRVQFTAALRSVLVAKHGRR